MGCVCPELCISGNLLSHVVFYHQRHFTLHMVRFRFKHWWRFIHPKSRHGMRGSVRTACKARRFGVLQSLWEKTKPDIATASFSSLWLDRTLYLSFKVMAVGCKMQIFDGGRVLMAKCKKSEKKLKNVHKKKKKKIQQRREDKCVTSGAQGSMMTGQGKTRGRG